MTGLNTKFEGYWISKIPTIYNKDASDYYNDIPNTLLRKVFKISKQRSKYELNVGCLGYYLPYINGKRVGDYELNSDWTQYDKTIYYDTYDITDLLLDGENVISFELGNGMYNPSPLKLFGKYNLRERLRIVGEPSIIANIIQLNIGKCILFTDDSWKAGQGSLLFNNLYLGERFDGRLFEKDWGLLDFDDSKWANATLDEGKKGNLVKSEIPKIKKKKSLSPVLIQKNSKGNLIIDFDETLSGMIDISFNGVEGERIKLVYAEKIDSNYSVDCYSTIIGRAGTSIGDFYINGGPGCPAPAMQIDEIITVTGVNHFVNKFSYHSFRYVEIIGLKENQLIEVKADYVYSDVKNVGTVKTSCIWINNLYEVAERTKLNNIHSVFEDCSRERLGYGGDMVALATSNLFMFDLGSMYRKVMLDFRQDQTENGGIPETAPYVGIQTNGTGQGEGPMLWQLVYPYIIYKCYQYYGDQELLVNEYPYLKKQMKYLMSIGIEKLETKCLGDHGSADSGEDFRIGTPDKSFLAYCTYVLFLKYNIYLAKQINDNIYEEYENELDKSKKKINSRFKNTDGTYGDKTQSSYAFAIFADITNYEEELCEKFVDKIKQDGYHLRSGIFGLMMTYEVLNRFGYDEIIEEWLFKEEYPSIGYMIKKGNKTLSEMFNMKDCSHNHAMLSSYTQWIYQGLAGIRIEDDAIKCNKVTLKPYFSNRINEVECKFLSYAGVITSHWKREESKIVWNLNIPKGVELYKIITSEKYAVAKTNYSEDENLNKRIYMELEFLDK